MQKRKAIFCVAMMLATVAMQAQHAKFVDPMLGTEGGGNVVPGATLPYGMVKASPDTGTGLGTNSGWTPDGVVQGFSQMHVSGTGGGPKYGNILLQATTGEVMPADHGSERGDERASAGYYAVRLQRYGIAAEIAAARRTAIYRFTFPAAAKANLLIDTAHMLSTTSQLNPEKQVLVASAARVVSPTEISGYTTVKGGWNKQPVPYTVYFYAVTDTPAMSMGTWQNDMRVQRAREVEDKVGGSTGAWLSFSTHAAQVVRVKIGISFVSEQKAKANAMSEIAGFDFDGTKTRAEGEWDKALGPIDIEGASAEDRIQFYTALYHSMLMPVDRTGENPLWQSSEPYYDDFYTVWDTFRTSSPLLTIIAQKRQSDIVRAMLDIYRHEGWLPDGRTGNYNGRVQGGSDGDMTIADAYLKHLPGIDWQTAYAAVVKDAEVTSPEPLKEGRGDLEDWKRLGYLSMEGSDRPASKSMEHAANDYAVALMAKGMGRQEDYRKYASRAENWRNLWDTQAADGGFTGFNWPRHRNGEWKSNFDSMLSGTWGSDAYYEGNSWTYSTYVPQDVMGLIAACGGPERFVERMNAFFAVPKRYDVGNEPGFLSPYLYVWAGRPDETQSHIRAILAASYHVGHKGLPGNDDSGAMSSWYAFGKMGFYPNAAQDVYLIGSPAFRRVKVLLPNGKTFTVETVGEVATQPYIASATWNGKPYTRAWFTHEQLMAGGTLRFTMSATPSKWGSEEPPPSLSDDPQFAK